MTKSNSLLSQELFTYLAYVLPTIDFFIITTIALTSANPWITTPLNITFPLLGILSTKMAVSLRNGKQQAILYCIVLPVMAINTGLLTYFGGLNCPAWVQIFPLITGIVLLLHIKPLQIAITVFCMGSLFTALWLIHMPGASIVSIMLAVFVFAAVLERTFSYVVKQRLEMEKQKIEIEEKNKEIIDSIAYAKRIQTAILPTDKHVSQLLPQNFVLYKPKDIVSGDFYWFHQTGDNILFAACDCTGHGVPGAMVSVVCFNSLNEATKNSSSTDPGIILDRTREIVIEQFQKSETDIKDGMDISFCSLNLDKKELKWSGANNPLVIIRNGEALETKPDKQPVGKHAKMLPFTSHTITLQKDDAIYIFTDGYYDQFGGTDGKKLKKTQLKELLLAYNTASMDHQKQKLDDYFENWKGNNEQIDDVCIIGVRV